MGLTVTYQSRYGQIRRQRTIPRNPRTPVQMEWRAAFQRELDSDNRAYAHALERSIATFGGPRFV